MRIPGSLETLHDQGIISDVVRPLMSGKEAQIYLVARGEELCVAKIYKEAQNRSFKNRADYTEGRKVRNSRDQRAMAKRTKHGREQEEAAWRSTEVDVIYRLHFAGVRVPTPYNFIDGVLVMELITDADGNPAPRLGDVQFSPEMAERVYHALIREVVRMLCAGIVHGDLSDFNVLLGADGPVIIDFPQSIDTAHNRNARQLLIRDVENLHRFRQKYMPSAPKPRYAEEMWALHENNALTPDTHLTGRFQSARRETNISGVLGLIQDANRDERKRRDALGLRGGPSAHEGARERPYYGGSGTNQRGTGSGSRGNAPQASSQASHGGRSGTGQARPDARQGNAQQQRNSRIQQPPSHAAHGNPRGGSQARSPGSQGHRPPVEVIVLRRKTT